MSIHLRVTLASAALFFSTLAVGEETLTLPPQLTGKVSVLSPVDPGYAQAKLEAAVKPAGQGGISGGLVVRLSQDIPVYRMWNGPEKRDGAGRTNRMGQWWSYDAPQGTQGKYRTDYEICKGWNDLTWVATCTLKAGAVVAIGPGQSVSAETCGDPTGQESYPANPQGWQTWVATPWSRPDALQCPPESADYAADPADISKPKPAS